MRRLASLRPLAIVSALAFALVAATGRAQGPVDPCYQCGLIYSVDGSGFLYVIDPAAGTSTPLGPVGGQLDIAASSDGRLFGMGFGVMNAIDTCTLNVTSTGVGIGGNAGCGDITTTDIFIQGPPLLRTPPAGPPVTVGGTIGGGAPGWCGGSSGDMAMNPADGMLYSTVWGCGCGGDALIVVDPTTGNMVSMVGCLTDASSGAPLSAMFGVAFDMDCRLLGGQAGGPFVWDIDTTTALATQVPIFGGYNGTFGFASAFCAGPPSCLVAPGCEPLTQGFWKRQCRGAHPSGEAAKLPGYVSCVAATATFRNVRTVDQICRALNPDPSNDKCQQAEAQFMALMLNTCSGRASRSCCIDSTRTSATTVGAAISEIDALLSNPARTFEDCVTAQGIADDINTGHALCSGSSPAPRPAARAAGPVGQPMQALIHDDMVREPRR